MTLYNNYLLKIARSFESSIDIGNTVIFTPMQKHLQELHREEEEYEGTVVAVRFTEQKVLFDIVDKYLGYLFKDVDSAKVRLKEEPAVKTAEMSKEAIGALLKTLATNKGIVRAVKGIWAPKSSLGQIASSTARNTAMVAGFNALSDQEMQEQHGFLGTFARKLADPRSYVMGAGVTLGTPLMQKAFSKGTAAFGRGPLGKIPGLGHAARLGQMFSNPEYRFALNAMGKGNTGKYIRKGFGEGGVDKSVFKQQVAGLKATDAYKNSTLWERFSDKPGRYDKAQKELMSKAKVGEVIPGLGTIAQTKKGLTAGSYQGEKFVENTAGGKLGVKGLAPAANPFSAFSITGIAATTGGVKGPWDVENALWSEDSSIYKLFGKQPINYSQFKSY